ncbi:hypothetical protein GCM10022277_08230 [Litoribacillus peritrichatus]|uniref:Uncharacterized protein n=1 Tax=Litoribacillus peritrichatus TaxID=718191 RepID=A0ABP7MA71_9GAMM
MIKPLAEFKDWFYVKLGASALMPFVLLMPEIMKTYSNFDEINF